MYTFYVDTSRTWVRDRRRRGGPRRRRGCARPDRRIPPFVRVRRVSPTADRRGDRRGIIEHVMHARRTAVLYTVLYTTCTYRPRRTTVRETGAALLLLLLPPISRAGIPGRFPWETPPVRAAKRSNSIGSEHTRHKVRRCGFRYVRTAAK